MTELYWLTRIGTLHSLLAICICISGAVALWFVTVYFMNLNIYEDTCDRALKCIKTSLCIIICSALALAFIPSRKDLLLIYGVGGTIDYVQSDTIAQKIPEKVIKACDIYLDEIMKDKE